MTPSEIQEKTFCLFRKLKPGQVIIVREFAKRNPTGFIQAAKDFIDAGNWNYEFSHEYKSFRRMNFEITELKNYPKGEKK